MIDRTEATSPPDMATGASPAASRRVFRSKVDTIRPTYGFEDVSLAPGTDTIEPADVDLSLTLAGIELAVPIIASAMDAVVDARMAGELARLGGLAIMNLEGVQARYDDPDAVLERIAAAPDDAVQDLLAETYAQPIREDLIAARIEAIHAAGSKAAVAATPGAARRFGPFCAEHGADLFLVQSQVSSARHLATEYDPLSLAEFTRYMPHPGRGRQHDQRGGRVRPHGAGRGGRLRRRRARRRVHDARGPRHRGPAGDRDQRCRGRPGRLLRRDRPLRPGGRRRRDASRRRAGEGHRRRRGRADDRIAARAGRGGARSRDELGDGGAVADAPARHADQGRDGRAAWSGSCSARRT